jgi:hypothetical protein
VAGQTGFQALLPDAAGTVPMVLARGFFGGGEAEYVQVLVDGVPMGDVESGIADGRRLNNIDHTPLTLLLEGFDNWPKRSRRSTERRMH